jgi:hypothetical protein
MRNPISPDPKPARKPAVLLVEPIFGLSNRMGFIDSAVALADSTGMRLSVLWFLDPTLNCRFEELFIQPQGIEKIIQLRLGPATRILRKLIRSYFSRTASFYADPKSLRSYIEQKWDFLALRRNRKNFLWGYCEFYPVDHPYRIFQPAPALQDVIASYPIDENTIGVHIRRGDSKLSILFSGTESFVRAMQREVQADPRVKFFLATDKSEEELEIRRLFPGRILSHLKRDLNRNSPAAARDAVVDLYCLSRCRKIIGSYYSSFSRVAWMIRGIEHDIIYDSEKG